jgi:DNA-binding CsgD family transcriptional regulator
MTPVRWKHTELEEASILHPVVTEGVVVVDLGFELVACDRGAGAILNEFGGGANGERHLPAEIRELLGARPPAELASLIFYLNIGDLEYNCRTFVVEPLHGSRQQTLLALHLKRAASVTDSLNEVAEDYGLTDRERETLAGVSRGLTTKALAQRMNISPNTVNAFLRLIMLKMGVTTRAGAVGRVLAQNGAATRKDVRMLRKGGFYA